VATVVGTAYVRLRLLTDQVGKDIAKAVEKNGQLQNIDIKVDADTAKADAKLAATGAEADKLAAKSPTIRPRVDSKNAERNLGLLSTAIAGLAPTIGPLAAAATAGFAGVAAGAGVALLAVHGVKEEMAAGTKVGQVYSEGLQTLKTDLDKLSATAAKGVLGGFQVAVTEITAIMPNLNQTVGRLSVVMGDLASRVVVGLVDGLITFEPLLMHVAVLADQAALHFAQWATGPGGAQFGANLGHALDEVIPTLVNLIHSVERLVVAAGPLGSTILSSFSALSKIILALPMPVLQALILGIVTLKTALTGLAIIERLDRAFGKFGTTLNKVGITSASGKFAALGAAGTLAGAALFGLSEIMNENAQHAAYVAKITQDYTQALEDSHGAITQAVTDVVLQDSVNTKLTEQLKTAGVTVQEWVAAIEHGGPALSDVSNKLLHTLGPARLLYSTLRDQRDAFADAQAETKTYTDAQDAANRALAAANPQLAAHARSLGLTATAYQTAETALKKKTETDIKNVALQKLEIDQNYQLAGTQQILADMYGVSTAQVQGYAAMLGITQKQVEEGLVTADKYDRAVRTVADAYNSATMAGAGFLQALQTFSQSAGTAADRAALIGATLKAANGDALGYAAALNGAAVAQDQLVKGLQSAAQQVGKNGESVHALVSSIVDLKTGTIDYTNSAAQPLIQGLQGIQDAAMAAAQAQFQHEVGIKGAKKAADDAYTTYVSQTRGSLIDEATQLGLTKDQAKKLADQYFGMPKDVKTKIEQEGADPIVQDLNKIGQQLAYLTGHPWTPKVGLQDAATAKLHDIQNKISNLKGKDVPINLKTSDQRLMYLLNIQTGINKRIAGSAYAAGGGVNEGWFTVGEGNPNTWELGYKAGPNVQIFSNRDAKAMTGMDSPPGYAAGTGININMMSDRLIAGLLRGLSVPMPSGGVGGQLGAWIAQAIALTGVPASWGPALARRAKFESGGNPAAINLTDQNARAGHPSKGLMQTIDSTFRAYEVPGHGNIWNPVDNMAAAIRYILSRYGSIFAIDPPVKGYKAGTRGARSMRMLPGFAGGTPSAAQLTQTRNQILNLRIQIDQADLTALRKNLGSTAAAIAAQLAALRTDLIRAAAFVTAGAGHTGQNTLLLRIEGDNKHLLRLAQQRDRLTAQLQAANQRLANLRQASAQETATVQQAVVGGFNISTAGQFQVGGGTYSNAAAILANLVGNVAQAKRFSSQLATLRKRGLRADLLQQLGEAGYQTAGANVAALAGASPAQLKQINAAYSQLGAYGRAAGQTVAGAIYGKQIAAAQAAVNSLNKRRQEAAAQMARLERQIEYLARALANRPVQLVANGRELARVVNSQNQANGRR
jgi:SLT domain-containing protein